MSEKSPSVRRSLTHKTAVIVIAAIIAIVAGLLIKITRPVPLTQQHWAVYYNEATPNPPALLNGWNLLVLDNDGHPDLKIITDANKATVKLAYVSLGEIASDRADFKDCKDAGLLLGLKKGQTQVYVPDIRKDTYYPLIKKMIEKARAQGFDGVMLDTLDTSIALGRSDEIGDALDGATQPFPGMQDAAIRLVKQIHADFPAMKIMVNRGFDLIPFIADSIDMVLAESTTTDGHAYLTGDERAEYDKIRIMLKAAHVRVYALDYWDMNDKPGVEKLYEAQRADGFCPYVSDPSLQTLYREP